MGVVFILNLAVDHWSEYRSEGKRNPYLTLALPYE